MKNNLINNTKIRNIKFENEIYFVLNDLISQIVKSKNPKEYIQKLKQRNLDFSKVYGQNVRMIEIVKNGNNKKMSCINFENLLKLIEFIPSKKIDEFKNKIYELGLLKIDEVSE